MDNLTHTMLGVAMARSGLAQRYGRGTTLLLVVASNLPDVDALWTLAGSGCITARPSRSVGNGKLPGGKGKNREGGP